MQCDIVAECKTKYTLQTAGLVTRRCSRTPTSGRKIVIGLYLAKVMSTMCSATTSSAPNGGNLGWPAILGNDGILEVYDAQNLEFWENRNRSQPTLVEGEGVNVHGT